MLFRRNILLFIMDQPAVDQGDYIYFFQVLDKVLNSILAEMHEVEHLRIQVPVTFSCITNLKTISRTSFSNCGFLIKLFWS